MGAMGAPPPPLTLRVEVHPVGTGHQVNYQHNWKMSHSCSLFVSDRRELILFIHVSQHSEVDEILRVGGVLTNCLLVASLGLSTSFDSQLHEFISLVELLLSWRSLAYSLACSLLNYTTEYQGSLCSAGSEDSIWFCLSGQRRPSFFSSMLSPENKATIE